MTVIPAIEQWMTEYTVSTVTGVSAAFRNYINVIISSPEIDGFRLDGNPITASDLYGGMWNVIGTSGYSGGMLSVTPGVHTLKHNSSIVPFSGISYGHVDAESYGYAGGMRLAPLYGFCQPSAWGHSDG
jgi:hypothetical protein